MRNHKQRLGYGGMLWGVLLGCCVVPAQADLNYTLTNPNVTASPGQTVTFTAALQNTGPDPLYLNTDFGIVDAPLMVDDSKFFTTWVLPNPQPTLPADGMTHLEALFDVVLPSDPSLYTGLPTIFNGSFTLYGGPTPNDLTQLGEQPFTITLGASAVPEPGTPALLLSLSAGSLGFAARKRPARK